MYTGSFQEKASVALNFGTVAHSFVRFFHVLADHIAREFRATSKRTFVGGIVLETFIVDDFVNWEVQFLR